MAAPKHGVLEQLIIGQTLDLKLAGRAMEGPKKSDETRKKQDARAFLISLQRARLIANIFETFSSRVMSAECPRVYVRVPFRRTASRGLSVTHYAAASGGKTPTR